jgi:deoxycytidylate deaminase
MRIDLIKTLGINKAKQSACRYRISAIGIDKCGDVIGVKSNKPRFEKFHGSIHAELNLMSRYGRKLKTIIICRINRDNQLVDIDPCPVCSAKAKDLGIKIVNLITLL